MQTHLKLKKALQKLKKYGSYLEEVVEERTVDLIKANEQLKTRNSPNKKSRTKIKNVYEKIRKNG